MRSAAILAGGRASRFGGVDKSALVVEGRAILDRQISELRAVPDLAGIVIVGGTATHPAARSIVDRAPGCGPLGGIHAALSDANERGIGAVFVAACDMPYISAALVLQLFEAAAGCDVVVPRSERGYHPLSAIYTRACIEPIARRLAERRLRVADLFDDVRARVIPIEERLLANVNTPGELAALHDHEV